MKDPHALDLIETFRSVVDLRMREVARAIAQEALRTSLRATEDPTIADLLGLLQEDLYHLLDDDPVTLGELLGHEGGPTLVTWLDELGLPLVDPLSANPPEQLRSQRLADLIATFVQQETPRA